MCMGAEVEYFLLTLSCGGHPNSLSYKRGLRLGGAFAEPTLVPEDSPETTVVSQPEPVGKKLS